MRFKVYLRTSEGMAFVGYTRLIDAAPHLLDYHSNRSYHCPACGKVWMEWRKEDSPSVQWYPYRRTCAEHSAGAWTGDLPGSAAMYRGDIVVLPRPLLERELLNLMEKQ